MKRRNSKGFTLVELLAVIVILAILMVSAGAGVMATMNNSKINTFKNEALTAVNSAENMYSEISMTSSISTEYLKTSKNGDYQGLCVTLSGLYNNGFLNKDLSTYGGLILIEVPYDGTAAKYNVWMHNGQYGIFGVEKNYINKLKYNKNNNPSGTGITDYGNMGIITKLDGLKSQIRSAMGISDSGTNPVSTVSSNVTVTSITAPTTTRGGSGQQYENIKCINTNIEQAS